MSPLSARFLSSLLLIPVLAMLWQGGLFLLVLLLFVGLLSAWEWWRAAYDGAPLRALLFPFLLHAAVFLIAFALFYAGEGALLLPASCLLLATLIAGAHLLWTSRPLWNGWGVFYLSFPLLILFWIAGDNSARVLLPFLLIVLASDSAAFFVGRWAKGPLLAPKISPGKTWTGALGGLVGAFAAAAILGALLGVSSVFWYALLVGIPLGVGAQIGDLLLSFMKRQWGVKDSGFLIPGHGGILDRMDSLLMAALFMPFLPTASL